MWCDPVYDSALEALCVIGSGSIGTFLQLQVDRVRTFQGKDIEIQYHVSDVGDLLV